MLQHRNNRGLDPISNRLPRELSSLVSQTTIVLAGILALLAIPDLAFTQSTGIAPGGCVLPGGIPSDLSRVPGSPQYFNAVTRSGSRRASAKTQQLVTAFDSVANDMDQSLGQGNVVQAFRHYVYYYDNAEQHQNDLDDMEKRLLTVKKRMSVVLEFAVTSASNSFSKTTDADSLMTLMEITNMPPFKTVSTRALQELKKHEATDEYKATLQKFKEQYQIKNLAPDPNTSSESSTGKKNRRSRK